MKWLIFLYHFSKTYVPAAILLLVLFVATQNLSLLKPLLHKEKEDSVPVQRSFDAAKPLSSTGSMQQLPASQEEPPAPQPKYFYLFEFTSGGRMEARGYEVKGNSVKILVKDGYEVTLARSAVRSIKKIPL